MMEARKAGRDEMDPAQHRGHKAMTRLDELLVQRGLCDTLSHAQGLILAGEVMVDGQVADTPGWRFDPDTPVRVRQAPPYVSRGGLKLASALDQFSLDPSGWACADVGSSTGGFTDCLLQRGASRVYAIDVGYGQLSWKLRQDPRVTCMERTNIRYLASLPELIRLSTIDVSFIGLNLVLPNVTRLLYPDGHIIALIKPQFELRKDMVERGGVVRDRSLHRIAILGVLGAAARVGLSAAGISRSPITGPAGNVEFLAWLRLNWPSPDDETVNRWVNDSTCQSPARYHNADRS
jgi:23S rRNA (cytidine1920-2'-O)/16S rRNA (cytidine1409-2'-O)-methyltransferase